MRNLQPPVINSVDILQQAINNKKDATSRNALLAALPVITARYQDYEFLYNGNRLETIVQHAGCQSMRTDLLSLYNYRNTSVQSILASIKAAQPQSVRYTCQYCTINSVNGLDHVINKDDFPEFSIYPFNLIPCCQECNSNKNHFWVAAGARLFINLYTDPLPTEQYLFMTVTGIATDMDFDFTLRKPAATPQDDWNRIDSHFTRLKLLARMRERAISEITEIFERVCIALNGNLPIAEIKAELKANAAGLKTHYGHNYWKAVMVTAMADSPVFWDAVLLHI